MVFCNEKLLEIDKNLYKDLWNLTAMNERVKYHCNLNFVPEKDWVLVFDEADDFIYSEPENFLSITKKNSCICLTATPRDDNPDGLEANILKHMKFKVFDYISDEYS